MSDELIPLRIKVPPGIQTSNSPQASEGRWIDADKVRFHHGLPEKIGGWEAQNDTATVGPPRTMMCWRDNSKIPYIAAGTYAKLYIFDPDSGFDTNDITPLRESGTLGADPFTTTNGSAVVSVADTSHGLTAGDYVHFSGASAVGGITISGEYTVTTVTSANAYTITHTSAASSSATGGGASVAYQYEIPIGRLAGGYGLGYGIGGYGTSTYGTARSFSNVVNDPRIWSLDHFGQILVATYNEGKLYDWDPSDPSPLTVRAALVTDAPTDCLSLFVTPERFVVALCADRVVKWSDQGDHTTFTPAVDNVAGQRTLTAAGSKLVAGRTVGAVNLIWSDYNVHIWQYVGGDFIWDSRLAGNNCGAISPNSIVSLEGLCFWMGHSGFFMYNGGNIREIPNSGDVHSYVFETVHQQQQLSAYLVTGMYCAKFHEVWWFFSESSGAEPSLYVIVELGTFAWSIGALERVGGGHFSDGETRPYWADSSGSVFLHEVGHDDDGSAMDAFVTLAPAPLDKAKRIMDIEGMETDFFEQSGIVELTLNTWDRIKTMDDTPLETVTEEIGESQTLADLRLAGRYANFTVRSNTLGGFFRFGAPAVYVKDSGVRR